MSWAQPEPDSGKRIRKPVQRRCVDYSSTVVRYLQARVWQRDVRDSTAIQPTPLAAVDMLPTVAYPDNPATSFSTKFVHCSTNKVRCSINRVLWTPTGRRLITGSQSGEFTLWNGQSFNFEMILQAHDNAIRSMIWSHNENWMVTGDDGGCIKYWQTNMNNVKANKSAHKEAVRDLSFSSTDLKFCSCSDDSTVKVWDFARCQEERALSGHGWDVKSVDWHPQKSLLVSGAKDSLVKLWDAKSGRELCTLHGHKNTVQAVKWNNNGNWLLTASKDQIIRLYDIRSLKDLESYRGHKKEVTALAWHPFHEELFVSGCLDGSIIHWLVGHEVPQAEISNAHESSVWDLAWHPMGHILCSGSNDHTTKFWCRNRPGDAHRDKYSTAHLQGAMSEQGHLGTRGSGSLQAEGGPSTPGTFLVGGPVADEGTIPGVGLAMSMLQSTMEAGGGASNPLAVVQPRGPHPPSSPHPSTVNSSIPSYQQHSSQFGQQNQQNQLHQMPQTQHLPDFSQPGQQHLALSQSQLRLTPPLPQQSSFLLGGPPTALSSQSLLSRPAAAQVVSGHPSSMSLGGIGIQGPPVRPGMAPTAPIGMALAASAPGSNIGIDLLAGNAGLLASQLGIGGRLFRSNIVQGRIAALSPLVPYGGSVAPLLPGQLVPVLPPFQANTTNNLDSAHGQVLGMAINIPQHHQHGPGQHL